MYGFYILGGWEGTASGAFWGGGGSGGERSGIEDQGHPVPFMSPGPSGASSFYFREQGTPGLRCNLTEVRPPFGVRRLERHRVRHFMRRLMRCSGKSAGWRLVRRPLRTRHAVLLSLRNWRRNTFPHQDHSASISQPLRPSPSDSPSDSRQVTIAQRRSPRGRSVTCGRKKARRGALAWSRSSISDQRG